MGTLVNLDALQLMTWQDLEVGVCGSADFDVDVLKVYYYMYSYIFSALYYSFVCTTAHSHSFYVTSLTSFCSSALP